jgi:Family of unknown function (DUF5958)
MHPLLIPINRAAQTPDSLESICEWFVGLDPVDRRTALNYLSGSCQQANPFPEDGKAAIVMSGLKSSFTPCVMVSKAPFPGRAVHRIADLPEDEHNKAFRLLYCLFAIADTRRRETQCRGTCTHPWHNLEAI